MIYLPDMPEDTSLHNSLLGLDRLGGTQLQRNLEACETLLRLSSAHVVGPAISELLIHSPVL